MPEKITHVISHQGRLYVFTESGKIFEIMHDPFAQAVMQIRLLGELPTMRV